MNKNESTMEESPYPAKNDEKASFFFLSGKEKRMKSMVHWCYKGRPNSWHTIEFDGTSIPVLDVKRQILKSRLSSPSAIHKLWNESVDYALFDAGSSREAEFEDESRTIPKNTHLIVHRLVDPGNYLFRRLLYNEPRVGPRNIPPTYRVQGR